jgi:hypothetical protein
MRPNLRIYGTEERAYKQTKDKEKFLIEMIGKFPKSKENCLHLNAGAPQTRKRISLYHIVFKCQD